MAWNTLARSVHQKRKGGEEGLVQSQAKADGKKTEMSVGGRKERSPTESDLRVLGVKEPPSQPRGVRRGGWESLLGKFS